MTEFEYLQRRYLINKEASGSGWLILFGIIIFIFLFLPSLESFTKTISNPIDYPHGRDLLTLIFGSLIIITIAALVYTFIKLSFNINNLRSKRQKILLKEYNERKTGEEIFRKYEEMKDFFPEDSKNKEINLK